MWINKFFAFGTLAITFSGVLSLPHQDTTKRCGVEGGAGCCPPYGYCVTTEGNASTPAIEKRNANYAPNGCSNPLAQVQSADTGYNVCDPSGNSCQTYYFKGDCCEIWVEVDHVNAIAAAEVPAGDLYPAAQNAVAAGPAVGGGTGQAEVVCTGSNHPICYVYANAYC